MTPIKTFAFSLAIGLAITAVAAPANAASQKSSSQETGFHNLHALKRVGGKLCMASHTHAGESLPSGNKAVAVRLAINNWQSFTAFEYGKGWGSWRLAWAKKEDCNKAAGGWVCVVTARPCRSYR